MTNRLILRKSAPKRIYINHKGLAYLIGNFPLRTPRVVLSRHLPRRPVLHFKRGK